MPLKKGRYVKVSVKDHGIGIPKKHLTKIFDPFFTTKEKGSGIGLAACYSIAKNHGGYITVESEIGVGTKFDIYLPASEKENFEVSEIVEEEIHLGKGKILFMDDQKGIRNMIKAMLAHLGYDVELTCDGKEAIDLYKKAKEQGQPFDAAILDLTVPGGMGGKETMRSLLAIDPQVKALVSSGYANNPILSYYKNYGFKGIIVKPYEIQKLSETLYNLLNGKEETIYT